MACHQHTQQGQQKPPKGFQQKCSYGPTTTQQQAHKRTHLWVSTMLWGKRRIAPLKRCVGGGR